MLGQRHRILLLPSIVLTIYLLTCHFQPTQSNLDSKSHLVKVTTTIMIENDGNTPITQHLIDCDERNGLSRLSHIVAKLSNEPMPVSKTEDGKWWRIDLSSKPIEPGVTIPLMVTKVYTHLELVPAHDIYLIPYSTIQYQVRIIKQGRPQKVKVPSEQYYLVVENKDLIDLDEPTSTALALESEGFTKIRFVDKSVIQDEDFIQPESRIHIVKPSYLTMHVKPGDSWALQKFSDYTIEIRIYDVNHNQIYPSDNLDIQLVSGTELVVTNSTTNGTHHTVHTLSSGNSRLVARLLGTTPALYSYDKPYQDIELEQELFIYDPLEVKPNVIVLPWLPESKPSYQVSLYAAGATGAYRWSTNNSALAEINYSDDDSSVAKITTHGHGIAYIQCVDVKSSVFLKYSAIIVSKIAEIDILPSITETVVGGDVLLPVAVFANKTALEGFSTGEQEDESDLFLFHDCSKIRFDVEIVEKSRFSFDSNQLSPNTRPKACISLKFTCNQPGSSRVWVSYSDPTEPLSKPIKTTAIIACYKPLRPVYPNEVGVLGLHTSIELAFEGGPRPFGSKVEDHYSYLEPNNNPIMSFEPIIDRYRYNKDLHVFKAFCNEYGEVSVTLNVGNQPSPFLPNPASSKASLKLICGRPDSIQIRPKLKSTCPLNEMASLIDMVVPISTTNPTDFEMIVFDDLKRPFLNISSYSIQWTLVGHGTTSSKQVEDVNAVAGFRRITRNYITVKPNGREGQGRLQADLTQYKDRGLLRGHTLDLTASLDVQFVDQAQISPNRSIIYNHDKNVVVLSILKGSGYFSVESLQGAKHANVSYVSVLGQHRINITPLSYGRFVVRLEDQCIESDLGTPILSEVAVVSDIDFSREASRPGRTLRYCRDVDESMFCLYLGVNPVKSDPLPTHSPIRSPPSTAPPTRATQAPKIEALNKPTLDSAATSSKPAKVETIQPTKKESPTTTTLSPKLSFDSQPLHLGQSNEVSILKLAIGYLLAFIVTASSITIAYKWWQNKTKDAHANSQFVTDSSFLKQSPSGKNVRFSPSSSSSLGPSSSTPRTRPLYTERFSTTLFSD